MMIVDSVGEKRQVGCSIKSDHNSDKSGELIINQQPSLQRENITTATTINYNHQLTLSIIQYTYKQTDLFINSHHTHIYMDLEQSLSESTLKKHDHLHLLLTDTIGYGHAQEKLSRSLYLLLFSQGCETIVLGFLLPILSHQWALSTFQKSMLITVVYLGVAVGSYLQVYSDKYGRYSMILWDTTLQTVFGLLSCVCWSFESFLFTRFIYGIGIGVCLPLSASYITQISPSYMRAQLLAKSRVYWSGGCLFTCFASWILLQNNNWRLLLFVICLPGIYALVEFKLYGKQSLRYLWVQKRGDEVYELVNYMCELNQRQKLKKESVLALMEEDIGQTEAQDIPLSEMFNKKYFASSVRLLTTWFSVCFIYYGIMILLPTILEKVFQKSHTDQNYKYMFLVAISMIEVAGFFLSSKIVDHPDIGRKKGVYYGLLIVFAVSLLIVMFDDSNITFLFCTVAIIKFIISATFMILYPYTAEIYETMIRGKALGICSFSGRIGSTLLGMAGIYAMKWFGGKGLYVLFIVLSGGSGYGAYTMPFCTINKSIS